MKRDEAMKRVQLYGLAIGDVVLFLDTHPGSKPALTYYDDMRKKYIEAVADYEQEFGPISADDVNTDEGWSWINRPWPWEVDE